MEDHVYRKARLDDRGSLNVRIGISLYYGYSLLHAFLSSEGSVIAAAGQGVLTLGPRFFSLGSHPHGRVGNAYQLPGGSSTGRGDGLVRRHQGAALAMW